MLKKVILSSLLVGLIGVLVAGAMIRTVDKTGNVAEAQGRGHGRSGELSSDISSERLGQGFGASNLGTEAQPGDRGGYGRGGLGATNAERRYPSYEAPPEEWTEYEGTVVQAPGDGIDLVIATEDGEELVVGTGPSYMESQGFMLEAGDTITVRGYWEGSEFKAAQVTRLRDGRTITLRDEIGRPAWAGAGRRSPASGQTRYGGRGTGSAGAPSGGTGQAAVDGWLTFEGSVVSADANALIVRTDDGQDIAVENRAWWFALEQGFGTVAGNGVRLVGFYEGDAFEVGQIVDTTLGKTVLIRDESGRPLWAGRGRRG